MSLGCRPRRQEGVEGRGLGGVEADLGREGRRERGRERKCETGTTQWIRGERDEKGGRGTLGTTERGEGGSNGRQDERKGVGRVPACACTMAVSPYLAVVSCPYGCWHGSWQGT